MANGLSGNCIKCGTWRRSLHRDHIIPRYKGGSDDPENIQLLCANCHEDKTVEDLRGRRNTPEQRDKQRKAQTGSKRSEVTRLRMALAQHEKMAKDAKYREKIKTAHKKKKDRVCDECGMRTNPASLGRHQSVSGHTGYTEASE